MRRILTLVLATCFALSPGARSALASPGWIGDEFAVPVRSGPSNNNRIVHRGILTGTSLDVIERDDGAGFVHIRTESGVEGWIESQYLSETPIAKVRLEQVTAHIGELEARLAETRAELENVKNDRDRSSDANDGLSRNVASLENELAELKRVSANAIEINKQKQELATLNERLRSEVDKLAAENQRLDENQQQRWMLIGAGLAFAGLIAGVAIKARPRRSGWS
jgi:SH3 domain protein